MKHWIQHNRKECGMLFLLLGICLWTVIGTRESGVEALFNSRFLSLSNLSNLFNRIGMFGIFSIGLALVIITGGIDLSVGSLMSLLGAIFFFLLTGTGEQLAALFYWSWPLAIAAVLLLGLICGAVHGLLLTKLKLQPFIVTLCGLLTYRGIAQFIAEDSSVGYSDSLFELQQLKVLSGGTLLDLWTTTLTKAGALESSTLNRLLNTVPLSFIYLLITAALISMLLRKTLFGRYLYASGRNETAARYCGINTTLVICSAYAVCGMLTAFSALLFAIYSGSVTPSTHGSFYELYGIAAAVLGGCSLSGGRGSVSGVLLGTSVLIVLQNMVNLMGYDSSLSNAITGVVIFLGILVDRIGPEGIRKIQQWLPPKNRPADRSFTLIELLFVVAVIAILLSIMLPSLWRSRRSAFNAVCKSNVSQAAKSVLRFTSKNNGRFPKETRNNEKQWMQELEPYSKSSGRDDAMRCPETSWDSSGPSFRQGGIRTTWVTHGEQGSIGINHWLNNVGNDSGWRPGFEHFQFQYISKIDDSSNTPAFMDSAWMGASPRSLGTAAGQPVTGPDFFDGGFNWAKDMGRIQVLDRHRKGINVSKIDGSASTVHYSKLWALNWHLDFIQTSEVPGPW